ncbi:hypothetical protein FGO68_gene6689 [Halteria grandinella]|uniref:Glucosamine 6-phosphate N-acetyltransferase n=1 Tax=Halteria grandinella TaxID=5974 RepID=A0A8J8NEV8_HALGN|nr:hypothetical protein FGO68_gene6689 [Halteria grandinella]
MQSDCQFEQQASSGLSSATSSLENLTLLEGARCSTDLSKVTDNQIQDILSSQCDSEFTFRLLRRDDYGRGIMNVLGQLTIVGDVTQEAFEKQFEWMFPLHKDTYHIVVIVDNKLDKIIGSGSLIMERKFLRSTGNCGHIEDVAVDSTYRGKKLGIRLIATLRDIASRALGSYKVTLDCAEHNVKFYEANGFKIKGTQMAWYREGEKQKL